MFVLLSPAKKLDPSTNLPAAYCEVEQTLPAYLNHSSELIQILKSTSLVDLKKLMDLSPALAQLNQQRYRDWQVDHQHADAHPSMLMFAGDVYSGLQAPTFSQADINFAQQHLGILSGLYGLLKPMDRIQAHRLEMGTALVTARGKRLYDFWYNIITSGVNERLQQLKSSILINLASQEYFNVLQTKAIEAKIITPTFKDAKNGQFKIISFYAKKARGLMARFIIQNRIQRIEDLQKFNEEGYWFNAEASDEANLVFYRQEHNNQQG